MTKIILHSFLKHSVLFKLRLNYLHFKVIFLSITITPSYLEEYRVAQKVRRQDFVVTSSNIC